MSDTTQPQDRSSKALLSWLWRTYLGRYKGWLFVAMVMMILEGSTFGVLSYMMKPMFDTVFIGGQTGAIWIVGAVIFGLFVTRAVSSVVQKVILTYISSRTAADIRTDLLDHLMGLDTSFHHSNPPGTLIERVQGDVTAVNTVWTGLITGLGRDLIAVVALFSVALYIDWIWTVIALAGIPVMLLPSLLIQSYVRRKSLNVRVVAADMSTRLDEVFHGINPIKLNSLERYQSDRFRDLNDGRVTSETEAAFGQSLIPSLVDLMAGFGFLAVLVYGGNQIIEGGKTVGDFMAFFTAMAIAFDPLRRLGNLSGLWQASAAAVGRLLDMFETQATLVSPTDGAAAPTKAPRITFGDVELSYGDLPVLHGTSFVAEAGKTTALVGASGAGKSTLFNVLTRLVEPLSGAVSLDDIDIKTMNIADLRSLVSTVSQDAALFDESLRDNILLGRTDVDDAHLDDTLKAAHIVDFLDKLPDGLNSPAGPRGSNLSGGQRQRVAIGRALLRDTPILLLDEATSALDTKSETIVQNALDRLAKGRTTLVIAHRLSTVRNADKIVVMDKGRVVDEGDHDELLARGGLYADLYRLQFRDGKQVVDPTHMPAQSSRPTAPATPKQSWLSRLFRRSPQT